MMRIDEYAKVCSTMLAATEKTKIILTEEFDEYRRLEYGIELLTGYTLRELHDKLAAGYTLEPPEPQPSTAENDSQKCVRNRRIFRKMRLRKKTVGDVFGGLDERQRNYVYTLFGRGMNTGVTPYPDESEPIFRSFTDEQKKVVRFMIRTVNASPDVA